MIMNKFLSIIKSRITISLSIFVLFNSPLLSQTFDFTGNVTGNITPVISHMKGNNTLSVKSEGVNLHLKPVAWITSPYKGFNGNVVTTKSDCIKKITLFLASGERFNLDKIDIQERHSSNLNLVLTAKNGSDVKGSVTICFTPSQGKTIDLSAKAIFKNITSVEITSSTKDACCGNYTYWIALDNVGISNVHQPLCVSSVSPDNGPVTGGTTVTIDGTGFQCVKGVKFGSINAQSFTVNSATRITAVSPAASAGTVDVTVITANGTSEITDKDKFTYCKLSQTISFDNPGSQTMGTSPRLTATATSGLDPVFTSATSDVCTVTTDGILTFLKPGNCTIDADQAGNDTYLAAPTVSQTFEILSGVPGAPANVTATADNGQATVSFTPPISDGGSPIVKYTVKSNDGIIAEGTSTSIIVTGLTNGTSYTFTVTATNANGEGPASAPSNSVTPTCSQTISFNNPGDQVYGSVVKLSATASSGLPVTFISMTTDVCTVSGDEATFKSVGTCTIIARQPGNHAFRPAPSVEQSFNVKPKTLTIEGLSAEDKVYDGTTQATLNGTAVLSGVVAPDNVTLSGTPAANFTDATAGTNKPVTVIGFTLTGDASVIDNYTLQQPTGLTADITKALPVLTWNTPAGITYGTALGDAQLNATSNIAGTFTYTPAAGTILIAGNGQTLSVTFTPDDLVNYQVVSKSVAINVTKASLTVTADNIEIIFGSTVPPLTYQYRGFVNGENASVLDSEPVISVESVPVNAGIYTIVVSGGSDNNYSFNYVNGTLTITKAVPVLTWNTPADITYGTALGDGQLNATSNNAGTFTYTPAAGTILNAGNGQTLSVTFTPEDLVNYQVVSKSVTINVTKASLTVTADNIQITYGSAVPPLTYQYSGFVNGENASILDNEPVISVESVPVNAGIYNIIVSGGSDNNYSFNYVNGTLTITKAVPVLTWNTPADIAYGTSLGDAQLNATSNIAGTFTYAPAAGTILNAGNGQTLSVTFTPDDLVNYQVVSKSVTINVAKAPLTITADNIEITYGIAVPPLTYQYSGFVNGENASVLDNEPVISVESVPVNAGTYTIVVSGGSDNNYSFNYVNGTLTIAKALPVLTWNSPVDITYGTALGDAQLNATSNIAGTFTYTPASGAILSAGNAQSLSVTFTPDDLVNYQVVSKSVAINVAKASLTVTADNIQITYGSSVPPLTYQYSGFVNGENASVLDSEPVISVESVPVNAGTYTIVVSGGSDNNYSFNYVNGTLTINKASLSIGAPVLTTSKTYDGNNVAFITPGAISGIPSGADVHLEVTAFYDNANVGTGKAITVSYVLTGADKGNYQTPASYVVNTGIITAKQLTISDPVVVTSKDYDGNTTAAIISLGQLSGLVTGEEDKVSVSATANYNDASVGDNKTITVAYTLTGSGAGNYIAPVNDVITGASIILKLSLSLENPKPGCDGGALQLPYTILEGSANSYRIVFSDAALAAGFSNIGFTQLPSGNAVSIAIPKGVKDGTYDAFLQVKNDIVSSDLYKFTFTINLTSAYLVKKFNDVILVDNSSNRFTSYQWYKNGTIIGGANGQFYNDLQGLSGTYHAVVTTVSGQTLEICPVTFSTATIKSVVSLKTYPNPAFTGNTVNIEIDGLSDEQLKGAVLTVFSNLGEKISSSADVKTVNSITSGNTAGVYFVRLDTADGNVINQKITITK